MQRSDRIAQYRLGWLMHVILTPLYVLGFLLLLINSSALGLFGIPLSILWLGLVMAFAPRFIARKPRGTARRALIVFAAPLSVFVAFLLLHLVRR